MTSATPTSRRGPVLLGLVLTMGLAAMDTTIVSTAVPQIVDSIGGFSIFSWLFSIYLLTQTVTIPVYGKLADVYGRKPVLLVGIVVFLAGSVLCSAAWSMVALIVFRGLQGIGAGAIQATVQTVAGDLYSLRERGRVQGWLSSVWAVSAITGPAVGGLFADYASWRWIFLINLPLGAVALTLIVRFLHEGRGPARPHRVDYLGSTLVLLTCGGLIFALLQGGVAWSWGSVPSLVCFGAVVVLGLLTVLVERRAAEPVVPGWVWRRRVLAGSNLGYVCLGLLVIGPSTFLPTYAQTVLGYGAVAAGFVLATMSISWPIAAATCSRLYLRIGFRDTALIGAVVAGIGVGGFLLAPAAPPGWVVVASTLVLGAGLGLISTPLVVGIQSTVDTGQRGTATGALMFCRFLGQSLGAAVFGAIVNGTVHSHLDTAPGRLPATAGGIAALADAVENLYLALIAVAVLTFAVLLIAPRRFPVLEQPVQSADDVAAAV